MNVFYCPGLSLWLTTLICTRILHTNEVERNLKTVSLSQKWPKNQGGLQQKPAWVPSKAHPFQVLPILLFCLLRPQTFVGTQTDPGTLGGSQKHLKGLCVRRPQCQPKCTGVLEAHISCPLSSTPGSPKKSSL